MEFLKKLFSGKPVFMRMLLLIFLLSFLPIILGSVLYYQDASSKIMREYEKNDKNLVLQAMSVTELIMDNVVNATRAIYDDDELLQLLRKQAVLNEYERGIIGKNLSRLKNISPYIHSIYLNFKNDNRIYSTEYGYAMLNYFPDKDFTGMIAEKSAEMESETFVSSRRDLCGSVFNMDAPRKVVTLVRILPASYGFNNEQIFINISAADIYRDIVQKLELDGFNELLILDGEAGVVFSDANSRYLPGQPDSSIIPEIIESGVSHREQWIGREKYLITYIHSSAYGWNYFWISPFAKITQLQNSIRNLIILFGVLLQLFIFLCGILVISRTAKPMDDLLKDIDDIRDIPRVGFNIFRYISHYMHAMINHNARLKNQLDRTIPVFRNQFLVELLTKKIYNPEGIEDRLKEFGIVFESHSFFVATIQILNLAEILRENIRLSTLKFGMEEMLRKSFDNSSFNMLVVNMDEEKTSILFSERNTSGEKSKTLLYNNMKNLCDLICSRVNVALAVGISENGKELGELAQLYDSSLKALQYRTLDTCNPIIFIDEVKNTDMVSRTDYGRDYEEKLHTFIATGNESEAEATIKQLMLQICLEKEMTKTSFDMQLLHIASMMMKIAAQANIDISRELLRGNSLLSTLGEVATVQDAEDLFVGVAVFMCKKFGESRRNIEYFNLQRILRYIDEHLHEDISVDAVSDHLNISSSNIFRIFRTSYDKTFVEYVTGRKLEKACELLQKGIKVKEVADRLGYSSSRYFIHVFKRYKGSSPNQYKCIMQQTT